jgi:hypothetical protein
VRESKESEHRSIVARTSSCFGNCIALRSIVLHSDDDDLNCIALHCCSFLALRPLMILSPPLLVAVEFCLYKGC